MSKFLVVLALISVVLAENDDAMIGTDVQKNQCIKELKLDGSKIHDIDVLNLDKMTHDEKCLLKCLLEKEGAIDAKVNLIPEESDEEIAKELSVDFSKCTPQQSIADLCERAFVLTKCAIQLLIGTAAKKS